MDKQLVVYPCNGTLFCENGCHSCKTDQSQEAHVEWSGKGKKQVAKGHICCDFLSMTLKNTKLNGVQVVDVSIVKQKRREGMINTTFRTVMIPRRKREEDGTEQWPTGNFSANGNAFFLILGDRHTASH